jgi:hypothetical protein
MKSAFIIFAITFGLTCFVSHKVSLNFLKDPTHPLFNKSLSNKQYWFMNYSLQRMANYEKLSTVNEKLKLTMEIDSLLNLFKDIESKNAVLDLKGHIELSQTH